MFIISKEARNITDSNIKIEPYLNKIRKEIINIAKSGKDYMFIELKKYKINYIEDLKNLCIKFMDNGYIVERIAGVHITNYDDKGNISGHNIIKHIITEQSNFNEIFNDSHIIIRW